MIISDKRNLSLPEGFPEGDFSEREFSEREFSEGDYKNKSDACMNLQASLFCLCVGHDTDLVGSNPTAGIYRQAKRTTSRCQ